MKYCYKCGTQLPDEANFCENCGAPQQAAGQATAQRQEEKKSRQEEKKSKKSLGAKMMDNFHTNMELQKQRRKNFKWWYWVIIAVALAYFFNM
jgi:uncharacterized membrane protein YvbJ